MNMPRIRGITIEQMDRLVEMTRHFYNDPEVHIYQDPDYPDNIIIASTKGDNYNTVGWYQVCYDLILPQIADVREKGLITGLVTSDDVIYSFINETFETMNGKHPVELLWSAFQAFKDDTINERGKNTTGKSQTGKT